MSGRLRRLMFAAYSRVSRVGDRSETLISPELQATTIRNYATGRGIEVDILPPELDQSGGKVARPILQGVIEAIEAGRYQGIIVAQLDRLSRMNILDALGVIRRVEQAGGEVIAVAENFDAGTPEGRMARNVMLSLAEMQLERYRRQFDAAKRNAVERGVWPMPIVPVGYVLGPDRRLVPDDTQPIARAFEARAAGASWGDVAEILGCGISQAGKVIRNRVYLGEVKQGSFRNPEAHQPLISVGLWEAAQIAHPRPPRGKHGSSLLTGLIRCAACGFSMAPERGRDNRYRCFPRKAGRVCPHPATISMAAADAYVQATVLSHLALSYKGAKPSDALEVAQGRLDVADAELVAYQRAVDVADIGAEHFVTGMTQRVRAVEQARREVAVVRLRTIPPLSGDLDRDWPGMSVLERRHVLSGFLGTVFVRKGRGPGRISVFLDGDLESEIRPAES